MPSSADLATARREAGKLSACAWCGAALVQDPDALHRWRCINAEQGKCVARGYWYILTDDLDYVPALLVATEPAPAMPAAIKESLKTDDAPGKPVPGYSPVYCALYPELAKVAREHGYALAIHGSLVRDFDLIAVPWVESPAEPDVLVEAVTARFALHRMDKAPTAKAHGRVAYTISVGFGECAIDLSFTPRKES